MMGYQTLISILILLSFSPVAGAQSSEWKVFTSPPDGFAAEFPGEPKLTVEKDPEFVIRRFTVSGGGRGFFVQSSDAGEEIPGKYVGGMMDSIRDGMAKGLNGKVSEEKTIPCGQHPGRSFVISGPEGWASIMLCASGRRMYILHAGNRSGPLPGGEVARFQGSFKVLPATSTP